MKIKKHKNMLIYKHVFVSYNNHLLKLFNKTSDEYGLLPLLGLSWGDKSLVIYLLGQSIMINWSKNK